MLCMYCGGARWSSGCVLTPARAEIWIKISAPYAPFGEGIIIIIIIINIIIFLLLVVNMMNQSLSICLVMQCVGLRWSFY